jgi:hypothetical protein
MFKPDKPTIDERKKERLSDCIEQLDSALFKLMGTLEDHDFEPEDWEQIDQLMSSCNLRLEDVKEEIKYS